MNNEVNIICQGFPMSHAERVRVTHRQIYEDRIEELRGYAEEDEDLEAVNEASIEDFWSFMESTGFSRRARFGDAGQRKPAGCLARKWWS